MMNLDQIQKQVMKMYEGRVNRYFFAQSSLYAFVLGYAGLFIVGIIVWGGLLGLALHGLFPLLVLIILVSIGVRRMHDIGWSGWPVILYLVPPIGFLLFLILLFWPGEKKANVYGQIPHDREFLDELLNR